MKKINYWVAGATFGNTDMYNEFIENGFWYIGWEIDQIEEYRISPYFNRLSQMQANDRIAIKRLLGQGQTEIRIMAIGIIKKVVKEVIFVNWLVINMNRHVPINGCVGTLYGPFSNEDGWTNQVFCL